MAAVMGRRGHIRGPAAGVCVCVREPESGDQGGVTPDKGAAEAQITLGSHKHLDFSLRATDTGGYQAGAGGILRSGIFETSLIFNE